MSTSLKDSQISVRLPAELKDQMETYAQLTGRSKSHVAMEALGEYLAWRIPQIEDLKDAVAAADRSEFATADEVREALARFASTGPAAAPVAAAKRRRRK